MKVLILTSHTPSIFQFRLDMIKDFQLRGHEVVVAGNGSVSEWGEQFKGINVQYFEIRLSRNGVNPFSDIITYRDIKSVLKKVKPDKIFVYQAKTVSYGCMAAKKCRITEIYPLVAGLGSIFIDKGIKTKIVRSVLVTFYKKAFKNSNKVFVQNPDDKKFLVDKKLTNKEKIVMINGSGVNLDKFSKVDIPEKPSFLYIGRLIKDKGVMEYLEACKRVKNKYGEKVRCLLVGPYDTNPSALTDKDINPYIQDGSVEYFGEQKDVRPYIAKCGTFVLPSYREGTPKAVLESMAMGRAIITTDAPGCRETVINGENGFLVPVKDVNALVDKMIYLCENPEINKAMGQKSYQIAVEKYDVKKVNEVIISTMGL